MFKMIRQFIAFSAIGFSLASGAYAQSVTSVTAPSLPALQPLAPGTTGTLNQTVSTGSKASLSFGSSTSFGASASLSGTNMTTTTVTSKVKLKDLDIAEVPSGNALCPTGNCISTRLGESSSEGTTTTGAITAEISNLRANNQTDQNSTDSNYTNGKADLGGVTASNDLVLDGIGSEFSVSTRTLHEEDETWKTGGADPAAITKPSGEENQLSNGSASAVVNSQTTVDINTNQFVSTFQQAY